MTFALVRDAPSAPNAKRAVAQLVRVQINGNSACAFVIHVANDAAAEYADDKYNRSRLSSNPDSRLACSQFLSFPLPL